MTVKIPICVERAVRACIITFRLTISTLSPQQQTPRSRAYIASEPPPFELVGKHASTAAAAGSGSKGQVGAGRTTELEAGDIGGYIKNARYIGEWRSRVIRGGLADAGERWPRFVIDGTEWNR